MRQKVLKPAEMFVWLHRQPHFERRTILRLFSLPVLFICFNLSTALCGENGPNPDQAAHALKRGVDYFRTQVSIEGGYLWRYSADFAQREGEVPASATTAWVQPPGTPAIGDAYLDVYELTGDPYYLDAARETALALVRGQLLSGGWDYRIEFGPEDRREHAYRADAGVGGKQRKPKNTTTLDDNTTQAALRFLMRADRAFDFQEHKIHDCVMYALQKLLQVQYPNGAWPQRFSAPPQPGDYPLKPASYPPQWSRTYVKRDYRNDYTFNDNTIADMIEIMLLAAEVYENPQYRAAAERAGDFMILAQMPDPQPGWAQQYNAEMHPVWARKFEPPAITGGESQRVMQSLLQLYEYTGKEKFLQPLPRALAYYRSCQLADGRLARFYELKTNQPLYFTKDYQLTYSDADMPTHYGFKTGNHLDRIAAKLKELRANGPPQRPASLLTREQKHRNLTPQLKKQASLIIASQNEQGAWVESARFRDRSNIEKNSPCIDCRTFARNITTLAKYLAATTNGR